MHPMRGPETISFLCYLAVLLESLMTENRSTHQNILFQIVKSQLNVAPGKFRGVEAMVKVASVLFPLVGTVTLFFILYNNMSHGLAILLVLLVPNLAMLLIPQKRIPARLGLQGAKLSALCVISVLATVLALEMLFPLLLPQRFNEVTELSKCFMVSPTEEQPDQSTVFSNSGQRTRSNGHQQQAAEDRVRFWHSPGRRFTYYGYDPNSKQSYVNRFSWNSAGYYDHDYVCPRPRKSAAWSSSETLTWKPFRFPWNRRFTRLWRRS